MRNPLIDFLKGFSIIGVFIIHFLVLYPRDISTNQLIDILFRFAVPSFIGILGYMTAHKYIHTTNWKTFYQNRFFTLFIPYFLWASVYSMNTLPYPFTYPDGRSSYVKDVFLGFGGMQFYYMIVYFGFIMLMPLLVFVLKSKYEKSVVYLGTLLFILLLIFVRLDAGQTYTQWYWDLHFRTPIHWLGYFLAGYQVRKIQHTFKWNTSQSAIILCIMGLVIFVYLPFLLVQNFFYRSYADPQLLLFSILMLVFISALYNLVRNSLFCAIITFIGKRSYGFYLSHVFLIQILACFAFNGTQLFFFSFSAAILYSAIHHWIEKYTRILFFSK